MSCTTIFPFFTDKDTCMFCVWAPQSKEVSLLIEGGERKYSMELQDFGYRSRQVKQIKPGTRYKYQLDGEASFPDPGSLSQPDGVHEASEVIDLKDFEWTDDQWQNISPEDMIQYELHTGTFTPQSGFEGIRSKIDYLKHLGINTIELMPVARFSGDRNWGYDGVYPFAVHEAYGGAKGLMTLVNECHSKGLAVILDVVYNHFGPEGNYVGNFGPYFSGKYSTPWGQSINFDGPFSDGVRNYFIQNALMWCHDFHIDGLRLDAVHAIYDFSARHIMREMAEKLEALSMQTGRKHYLIAESHLNDVRYISPVSKGGYGLDAQWSDDFHHALHTLVTHEKKGYYMDYGGLPQLSKAYKDTFIYDGKYSPFRKKTYGSSVREHPGSRFVIFNQNHDQVGNRLFGERLISLAGPEAAKLAAGAMFLAPNIPMLFMGEEYGEDNPFYYFVSHRDPELNRLVCEGRKKEFREFYDDPDQVKNPDAVETFDQSGLSWNIDEDPGKKAMFEYYREWIRLRKEHPVLRHPDKKHLQVAEEDDMIFLQRWNGEDKIFAVLNFSEHKKHLTLPSGLLCLMNKDIDSAEHQWNGPGSECPCLVKPGEEIRVKGYSVIMFSNR